MSCSSREGKEKVFSVYLFTEAFILGRGGIENAGIAKLWLFLSGKPLKNGDLKRHGGI